MSEPRRIQLSRSAGWRIRDVSSNYVIVDRRTVWGNPWTIHRAGRGAREWMVLREGTWVGTGGRFRTQLAARVFAVEQHRRWLLDPSFAESMAEMGGRWVREHLHELAGKDLACWCSLPTDGEPDVCHAATLLTLARDGARP